MSDKYIVSLSGGKDSTAMLLMLLENNYPIDEIIFIDTTKEFPDMYEHLNLLEKYITPYKITKLKINFDYYMFDFPLRTKNKIGYGWPAFIGNRWCTGLKREIISAYLTKNIPKERKLYKIPNNIKQYIGIAYDEQKRTKKHIYPLIDLKMTEKDCLNYCKNKGFHWNGLYDIFYRVSCYCCPFTPLPELKKVYNLYPSLWENMKEMDKKANNDFRCDKTLNKIEKKFKAENEIISLF